MKKKDALLVLKLDEVEKDLPPLEEKELLFYVELATAFTESYLLGESCSLICFTNEDGYFITSKKDNSTINVTNIVQKFIVSVLLELFKNIANTDLFFKIKQHFVKDWRCKDETEKRF